MPGTRRTRKGQTQANRGAQAPAGDTWDKQSGPDEYDGRANLQAGDKGKEPGGRWSAAYYESGPKVIGKINIRDA